MKYTSFILCALFLLQACALPNNLSSLKGLDISTFHKKQLEQQDVLTNCNSHLKLEAPEFESPFTDSEGRMRSPGSSSGGSFKYKINFENCGFSASDIDKHREMIYFYASKKKEYKIKSFGDFPVAVKIGLEYKTEGSKLSAINYFSSCAIFGLIDQKNEIEDTQKRHEIYFYIETVLKNGKKIVSLGLPFVYEQEFLFCPQVPF